MNNVYQGKLLRVNLTTKSIKDEVLDRELAKKYIGGRGLGTKLLMDEIDPMVDPLSEGNKVFFMTGPLTGVKISTGTRYMVVTKSPLNNMIASSNGGGIWGSKLKYFGYDGLIVEGKSETPVYLELKDGEAEIKDAKKLWGKITSEVEEELKGSDKNASALNIGPAGENLSLMAAVMNDGDRAAARTGVGAVLGSKNLKAIVVSSALREIKPFSDNFANTSVEAAKTIKAHPVAGQGLPAYGTAVLVNIINGVGSFPTKNWQEGEFAEAENISGEELAEKHLVRNSYCHRCTIGCGRVVKYEGKEVGGPEYETIWGFGGSAGVSDMESIIAANHWCNEMGLDTISTASTLASAMELYQRGIINDSDCDGLPLEFNNGNNMVEWVKKVGRSEGKLGKMMAQGSYNFCNELGVPQYSMSVKKLEMPAYDARGIQGIGLNYATSNRGGCHVRGYTISPEVLGVPEQIDRSATEGKAVWVKVFQDLTAIIDSLGLCLFTSFALGAEEYRQLFNYATGNDYSLEEFMMIGERIYTLERLFNQRAGMKPEDDKLPKRLLEEPLENIASKGEVNKLDEMLGEYYAIRGWEKAFPTKETLQKLGIA